MRYLFLFLSLVFIVSCQSEPESLTKVRKILSQEAAEQGGFQFSSEEALCQVLNPQKIEEIFGIKAEKIKHKPRGYIFKSPNSASCEAQWETRASIDGTIVLQMFCNPNTNSGTHIGENYLNIYLKKEPPEGFRDKEKYYYHEISGVGDRAVYNQGFGILKWYVGNYVAYSLQIQTSETDYSEYRDELIELAHYVTSRTMETLN